MLTNAETALQTYLNSLNYTIDARPLMNSSLPIVVWMAVRLFKVVDFSSAQRLTVMATVTCAWNDDILQWNPSHFGGLQVVYRRVETMWKSSPFVLVNAAIGSVYYSLNTSHPITLQYTGTVTMDISSLYSVVCEMDVLYFPWDTQLCQIQIKSIFSVQHLVISPVTNISLIASADPSNSEWQVAQNSVVHYASTLSVLSGLYFPSAEHSGYRDVSVYFLNITLVRTPTYYLFNVIIPVVTITGLSMLSFFIPGSRGERIGLTLSAFLSFSVFQSYVADFIPRSQTIPVITRYILAQMLISAVCVASSVLSLNLADSERKMSGRLRRLVHLASRILLIHINHKHGDDKPRSPENNRQSESGNPAEAEPGPGQSSISMSDLAHSHNGKAENGNVTNRFDKTARYRKYERRYSTSNSMYGLDQVTIDGSIEAAPMDSAAAHKNGECSNEDWILLGEILNRLLLIACFAAAITLTVSFLVTAQLYGPLLT